MFGERAFLILPAPCVGVVESFASQKTYSYNKLTQICVSCLKKNVMFRNTVHRSIKGTIWVPINM